MQERETIPDLLRKFYPILTESRLLEEISESGAVVSYQPNDLVMDYGAYVKTMPLILQGSIKVSREDEEGNELFLYYLAPGETCTMTFSCCMANKKSEFRAVAEEATRMIALPVRFMDPWMAKYPGWRNFVLTSYDNRMLELIRTIDNIAFKRMDQRLMDYLREKVRVSGSTHILTTHQDIAYDLNASREAVSRLLKKLEKEGVVKLGRNHIQLVEK
jgi:CRP/FNR family transcriptional regulator